MVLKKFFVFLACIVLFNSCVATTKQLPLVSSQNDQSIIFESTPNIIVEQPINIPDINLSIAKFKQRLQSKQPLTEEDWQLHDKLLQAYVQLKDLTLDNVVSIPSHSRKKISLETFCMNPGIPSPHLGEKFIWKKDKSEIPYFREVIEYAVRNPQIDQRTIQTLIWNLKNGTDWEYYPQGKKDILLAIDPRAPFKLPSKIKDKISDKAKGLMVGKLKEWGLWRQAQEISAWAKDQYQDIESIERELLSLKSKFPLDKAPSLEPVSETPLFAETVTHSHARHDIIFYNPTDRAVNIDLTQYYMQSKRPDVQRMGLKKKIPRECRFQPPQEIACSEVVQELEDVLYGDMLRMGLGFIPLVGDAADIYEFLTGKHFSGGPDLTWQEQLLSGLGLVIGSGEGYRYALRTIHAPAQYIAEFSKGISKRLGDQAIFLTEQGLNNAKEGIRQAKVAFEKLKQSPATKKFISKPNLSRTDFYVRSNGDVIPSKAYRYIREDAEGVENTLKSGTIKPSDKGTYLSFDDFRDSADAKNYLQIPKEPRYKAEVDTLQSVEDLKIPKGSYGNGDNLEPITETEFRYGKGGATQAVTNKELHAKRIIDMKDGKVVYEEATHAN